MVLADVLILVAYTAGAMAIPVLAIQAERADRGSSAEGR